MVSRAPCQGSQRRPDPPQPKKIGRPHDRGGGRESIPDRRRSGSGSHLVDALGVQGSAVRQRLDRFAGELDHRSVSFERSATMRSKFDLAISLCSWKNSVGLEPGRGSSASATFCSMRRGRGQASWPRSWRRWRRSRPASATASTLAWASSAMLLGGLLPLGDQFPGPFSPASANSVWNLSAPGRSRTAELVNHSSSFNFGVGVRSSRRAFAGGGPCVRSYTWHDRRGLEGASASLGLAPGAFAFLTASTTAPSAGSAGRRRSRWSRC